MKKKLTDLGFSVNTGVSDKNKKTYGNRLISLHHRFGLYIVDGCVGKCEKSILSHFSKTWLSSRIFFQGEGAAKTFLGGAPSKFSGANDSRGGGKIFLKKMKFSHRVEISIISAFQ